MTSLFRKRLIPDECINLKDDRIIDITKDCIITSWKTLHPKPDFDHGISFYVLDKGWKISQFYKADNSLLYTYCDIIDTEYNKDTDTYIFTDLLADVIIEPNGLVRVVDLDELADACDQNIISNKMLTAALHQLNELLTIIYNGEFNKYIKHLEDSIKSN